MACAEAASAEYFTACSIRTWIWSSEQQAEEWHRIYGSKTENCPTRAKNLPSLRFRSETDQEMPLRFFSTDVSAPGERDQSTLVNHYTTGGFH